MFIRKLPQWPRGHHNWPGEHRETEYFSRENVSRVCNINCNINCNITGQLSRSVPFRVDKLLALKRLDIKNLVGTTRHTGEDGLGRPLWRSE